MPAKFLIRIMPKQSVLDPQGVAVLQALGHLGAKNALSVRVGKAIELEWDGPADPADPALNQICRDVLSNPVIEDYTIEPLK